MIVEDLSDAPLLCPDIPQLNKHRSEYLRHIILRDAGRIYEWIAHPLPLQWIYCGRP